MRELRSFYVTLESLCVRWITEGRRHLSLCRLCLAVDAGQVHGSCIRRCDKSHKMGYYWL